MVFDCNEKVALVTGGAAGIGLGYVKKLLSNGFKGVAILDIDESKGNQVAAELGPKVFFLKVDTTNKVKFRDAFVKTIEKFGGLDLVINHARICNESDFELMIDINAKSVVTGTLLAIEFMRKDKGGKGGFVVNTSSILGLSGASLVPVYYATKHFIIGFGKSMGTPVYYEKTGIKVMTIAPGLTDTRLPNNAKFNSGFNGLEERRPIVMEQFKLQPVDAVADCLLLALNVGNNGSVWVVENGQDPFEFKPERPTIT
ncbi:PREDICTED: 15-hydroxyprostaglandin dehydrogenase [NAD(+)]-like [Nicrophorus vespilloides]|uniref:15-hydroxyprostaglandin dehydrogenase [NAD(+)]-like n=1 Tax=Nicrophorus vespilloides TaxID=110193 RepID=A0ABM1M4C2_NICVS|nr:PREDICTED: 15-hydroxyprostaglandin dehydrogenase [NAD(+)]-like [Nicrophorus vespilloides]